MAYLALYRLFRPTAFSEVVEQKHVVKILTNQIETGKIGHAYLFCGPRGTGKTSVAKIFARAVNCEHPDHGSPCGQCATCRALSDPSNLDIVEIDAASNNGVNEMRDLREKVQYPPVAGNYKVYIVDEVHMLSDSAFNALLKTLEEPPRHAIFILATTEPHKIPATILSRCMRFDFKLLPRESLEALLRRVLERIGKDYEEEAVAAIVRAGAGSVRDMLSIADTCVSYDAGKLTYDSVNAVLGSADFSEIVSLVREMLDGDRGALASAEHLLAEGRDVGVLCRDILSCLNRIAVAKLCRGAKALLALPDSMYEAIASVAETADGQRIVRTTELFAELETSLRFASSPRILLETAIVKAAIPASDSAPEGLLSRLSALERRIDALERAPRSAEAALPARSARGERASAAEARFLEEPPKDKVTPLPVPAEPPQTVRIGPSADVKNNAIGKFLRAMRRLSRGGTGVLVTMCTELKAEFEGETFVLSTEKEIVYATVTREENRALIEEALHTIGISDYRIEFADGNPTDAVAEFEREFSDQTIIKK